MHQTAVLIEIAHWVKSVDLVLVSRVVLTVIVVPKIRFVSIASVRNPSDVLKVATANRVWYVT